MFCNTISISVLFILLIGCSPHKENFNTDINFLKSYTQTIVLASENGKCQIAVTPNFQAKVMTSTSNGLNGKSYGWINYDLIASGKLNDKINAYGGEDRFWLGPEGGQYSIFFKNGDNFNESNWSTPSVIDSEPFDLIKIEDRNAIFSKSMKIKNYQNFEFEIDVQRHIKIFTKKEIENNLSIELHDSVHFVGFRSYNCIRNSGKESWSKSKGLLSIWILGMFNPSSNTSIIIPYTDSLELNTSYFGKIKSDRLMYNDSSIFFKGDGAYRCKIGIPSQNATPYIGSYDSDNHVLTIVKYSIDKIKDSTYVNSLWEHQKFPYKGDVINAYNDGPMNDGSQLGPFFELESSSATRELNPGENLKHTHETYHFEGSLKALNTISIKLLGTSLDQIPL